MGLGYQFSYSVLFMTSETERMREKREGTRERKKRVGTYKSTFMGSQILSSWSTFEFLASCAPYANAITIELTIGL